MDLSLLSRLNEIRAARGAAILITDLETGHQRLIQSGQDCTGDPLETELTKRFHSGKSGTIETKTGNHFLTVSVPSPRLVLIGAVHITQALVPMAELAGFDVTVIDPRTAFATEDRFPSATLKADWPEEVLKNEPLDAYTALAAVTHDPKIDDFPLQAALKAGCFYVGALGSRKTHGKRLDRLRDNGVTETDLARIEAPIGQDIGAASPAEIAVAILGSVIKALRKPGTV
ncbi:XdhC/CoxI family protein [Roseibium sp. TrichSKD4]|uniref:XdhC family protein n=1 Tax=Roseibium sp. TrichSKD4 TaxID=744980 RepID=UPI0001E5675B|nr:XdhC family protein [Roseibium sp. TrichSKD4]EFO32840.1 XdhC/CoxI family protein [Roseibium sp. TrichSKD4]